MKDGTSTAVQVNVIFPGNSRRSCADGKVVNVIAFCEPWKKKWDKLYRIIMYKKILHRKRGN